MKGFILKCALLALMLPSLAFAAQSFTVMSYNVENLFDTKHDEGKKDFTYLPLAVKKANPEVFNYCRTIQVPPWREECYTLDWSEKIFKAKIRNLSKVIKSFDNNRQPDILVLQEVENLNAVQRLNTEGNLNYENIILIEGEDSRGIDVAILSNFAVQGEPELHYIDTQKRVKTRGILEAKFEIYGNTVAVFANHWPSQFNPDELRALAAKKLMFASSRTRADIRIAAGDFNTKPSDNPNGIDDVVLLPRRSIYFLPTNPDFEALGNEHAEGSHWYRGKWHFLDRIFIDSKSTENGVRTSFILHAKDYMLKEKKYRRNKKTVTDIVPYRFKPEEGKGYSDHLPIGIVVHIP